MEPQQKVSAMNVDTTEQSVIVIRCICKTQEVSTLKKNKRNLKGNYKNKRDSTKILGHDKSRTTDDHQIKTPLNIKI